MSLIRRKSIPKLLTTSEVVARWGMSDDSVRRILKKHNVRQFSMPGLLRPNYRWVESDVLKVEEKIFAAVL